jgi:flagellar secretion chaperone FliS
MNRDREINPERMYREAAVRSATPVGLIIILYEEISRSLNSSLIGLRENNAERRTHALSHVIEIVGHLQSVLDFDRGGEVAVKLWNFYNFVRARVLEANIKASEEIIVQLIDQFSELTKAWRQVDGAVGRRGAEGAANPVIGVAPGEPAGAGSVISGL